MSIDNIGVTSEGWEKAHRVLEKAPDQIPVVIARAMNRSAKAARTKMTKETTKNYNLKYGEVLNTIKINPRAHKKDLHTTVTSKGPSLSLLKFTVSHPKFGGKDKKPLYVQVKKGKRVKVNGAFVARSTKTGKSYVFTREGRSQYPIHPNQTIPIPWMIASKAVIEEVERYALETFDNRIDHELRFVLGDVGE